MGATYSTESMHEITENLKNEKSLSSPKSEDKVEKTFDVGQKNIENTNKESSFSFSENNDTTAKDHYTIDSPHSMLTTNTNINQHTEDKHPSQTISELETRNHLEKLTISDSSNNTSNNTTTQDLSKNIEKSTDENSEKNSTDLPVSPRSPNSALLTLPPVLKRCFKLSRSYEEEKSDNLFVISTDHILGYVESLEAAKLWIDENMSKRKKEFPLYFHVERKKSSSIDESLYTVTIFEKMVNSIVNRFTIFLQYNVWQIPRLYLDY